MMCVFRGVVYLLGVHACLISNLVQGESFSFPKRYFNSSLNLTESKFLVYMSNFLGFTFSHAS